MKKYLLLLLIFVFQPAMADAESERANLAKLIGELDYLIKTVDDIAADSPPNQPYFRYDLLKGDMQSIRDGITSYFNSRLSVARDIKPLRARYTADEQVPH